MFKRKSIDRPEKLPDKEVNHLLPEEFSFSFLGIIKMAGKNPSRKTMLLAILFLIAITLLTILSHRYLVPALIALGAKDILASIGTKAIDLIKLLKGR